MRRFACLISVSLLSLAPRLALAQDPWAAPNVPDEPPAAGTTVVVIPAPTVPAAAPAPVWYAPPASDRPVMRRRNERLMVGGLVMIPVGLAMAIGGGVWASNLNSQPSCTPQQGDGTIGAGFAAFGCAIGEVGRAMSLTMAYTLAFMGGAVALGGGVMTGIGASMVPAKPTWQPQVSVGAGSASLKWTF